MAPTDVHGPTPLARTIDELMQIQSSLNPHDPVVSYPSSGTEYIDYNLRQLDTFAFRVAKQYQNAFPSRLSSSETAMVVGLIGVSNLDYIITMLALTKLGHTVLLMSPRITKPAYEHLLKSTGSRHLVYQSAFQDKAVELQKSYPELTMREAATLPTYNDPITNREATEMTTNLDLDKQKSEVAWIFHSSGSTGLPKPIYITHKAALGNYRRNMDYLGFRSFLTLPVYHTHGISSLFRAFISGKTIRIYSASLPLTKQNLIDCMGGGFEAEIFCTVPYALKILHESRDGIELLLRFNLVTFGGAPCPDPLGDALTALGVKLMTIYGMGETGPLMTSWRPDGDDAWTYLRPPVGAEHLLAFEDRGDNLYELVVSEAWPSRVASNRPDGSYATKDLFVKHPTLKNAWKYSGRIDDVIVLEKGEKANPLPIEGAVRQHDLVAEAVVFGVGKPHFGIVIVLAPAAEGLTDDVVVDRLAPLIERSQDLLPDYAKISRDMVILLPHGTAYPRTDKGTVIRKAFYAQFASTIDEAYVDKVSASARIYSETELKDLIRKEIQKLMGIQGEVPWTDEQDLFQLGMDSLHASRLRGILVKTVNTHGKRLDLNIVFNNPTVSSLARELSHITSGGSSTISSNDDEIDGLIERYGTFTSKKECIVLTGATGSLGAHILAKLARQDNVQTVYCLVRAASKAEAQERIVKSMITRKAYHTLPMSARRKIMALPSRLGDPTLGLESKIYTEIANRVSAIYHIAWTVNFNLRLSSFEKDCIAGLRHLLDLCLRAGREKPAKFAFCSSVGVFLRTDSDLVPEALPDTFSTAQPTGYAQSKLVAEHICVKAIAEAGIPISILRVGQIIGDSKYGIWNSSEAVPLMLQTAKTIGTLPTINESLRWLPVDLVAQSMIEITDSDAAPGFFNLINPKTLHWTHDLLPYLRRAGLDFEERDPPSWLAVLRASDSDPVKNPPVRLMDYLESNYDTTDARRTFDFQTDNAQKFSETFKRISAPDEAMVRKMVHHFLATSWKERSVDAAPAGSVIVISGSNSDQKMSLATALSTRLDIPVLEHNSATSEQAFEAGSRALLVTSQLSTKVDRDSLRKDLNNMTLLLLLQEENPSATAYIVADEETDVVPLDAQLDLGALIDEALCVIRSSSAA